MSGRIHVFPAWEQNPYLNMLYVGARAEGWRIDGSKTVNALAAALPQLADGDLLHVHWTGPVLQPGDTSADAREAFARFADLLERAKESGVRLIWTVHNALAHDAAHPDLEVELARLLADKADHIIQINRSTRQAVFEYYELPLGKLATLRHASYLGIYPDPPSQYAARQRLGIPAAAQVVGFVGQMRGYKGIPTLLRAVESAARTVDDLVLVLAGKTPPEDVGRIERGLPAGVSVVRDHSFVKDEDLGWWFSACDVMVFPYERVLNSGSVLLSSTFGRPCILPAEPHLVAEFGEQPWVTFYDTGDDRVSALAHAIPLALSRGEEARQAALRFASEYTTFEMAWDYWALVESMFRAVPMAREGI